MGMFTSKGEFELNKRSRELDKRLDEIVERENDVDHKIKLADKIRGHEEAIATIARQDQKLEEDHNRRKKELDKEIVQIELNHEHRMDSLRAEEMLVKQQIESLVASNDVKIKVLEEKNAAVTSVFRQVVAVKDTMITQLQQQLDALRTALVDKLPEINVKDITVLPSVRECAQKQDVKK